MIFGERDKLIDITSARALQARHPSLDLEVLDGIGHAPQLEAPTRFVDAVENWLTTLALVTLRATRLRRSSSR